MQLRRKRNVGRRDFSFHRKILSLWGKSNKVQVRIGFLVFSLSNFDRRRSRKTQSRKIVKTLKSEPIYNIRRNKGFKTLFFDLWAEI